MAPRSPTTKDNLLFVSVQELGKNLRLSSSSLTFCARDSKIMT